MRLNHNANLDYCDEPPHEVEVKKEPCHDCEGKGRGLRLCDNCGGATPDRFECCLCRGSGYAVQTCETCKGEGEIEVYEWTKEDYRDAEADRKYHEA